MHGARDGTYTNRDVTTTEPQRSAQADEGAAASGKGDSHADRTARRLAERIELGRGRKRVRCVCSINRMDLIWTMNAL
jgi:hypothetical protein